MQPPATLASRLARRNLAPRRFRSDDVTRDLRAMMDDPLKTEARDPAFMGFVDRQFRRVFGEDPAARDATGRLVQPRPKRDDLEVFRPALRRDDTRLRGGVGRGQENDPGDVGRAQRLLSNAGTFDLAIPRERSGTPSDALFDGIAAFQAQAGLRPDGVMRPGGPTVAALDRGLGVGALTRAAQQPPDDGFRPLPPEDGGQLQPPDDGFRPQPPAQGGAQQPPDDGFRPVPPDDGASPAPGSEPPQQPPDDGFRPVPGEDNDPDPNTEEEDENPGGEDGKEGKKCNGLRILVAEWSREVARLFDELGKVNNEIEIIEGAIEEVEENIRKMAISAAMGNIPDIVDAFRNPIDGISQNDIGKIGSRIIRAIPLLGDVIQVSDGIDLLFLRDELKSRRERLLERSDSIENKKSRAEVRLAETRRELEACRAATQ